MKDIAFLALQLYAIVFVAVGLYVLGGHLDAKWPRR